MKKEIPFRPCHRRIYFSDPAITFAEAATPVSKNKKF